MSPSERTSAIKPVPGQPTRRPRGPDWLHPGWSWTVGRVWVITALSASVTLILGAVLGTLPALLAGSWRDPQTRDQTWVLIGFTAASLAAAATAIVLHRKRRWVLQQNGTAYVIQELAGDWDRQDEKAFLESAGRYFARVIKVPSPGQLGRTWDWSLDPGAQHWDGKADELARAFQALRSVDDPGTPNGILMWASWAVAVAFGLRVSTADRDLVLNVWQRPSHGRAGDVEIVIGTQRPHRFGYAEPVPLTELLPGCALQEFSWHARLTATRQSPGEPQATGRRRVSVLLLRVGYQEWGPLPAVDPDAGSEPTRILQLKVSDAAGVTPNRSSRITIHELRCLPSPGDQFPWPAIPSLVTAAADWVERKSAELAGHILLLGTIMSPEAALGLGITAGHPQRTQWPQDMWPLVYQAATHSLVVPYLNLGKTALGAPKAR
jgi:hypothetical protein